MKSSGKKGYATDLAEAAPPSSTTIEEAFASAREQIGRVFADSAQEIAEGYVELATSPAVDDDVRRKAMDRVLDTFLPTERNFQKQLGGGTTIQILNAIPMPESRVIDGKEQVALEIGNTKVIVPKRLISPGEPDAKSRRAAYLGPAATTPTGAPTGTSSPMPAQKQTNMPEKLQ